MPEDGKLKRRARASRREEVALDGPPGDVRESDREPAAYAFETEEALRRRARDLAALNDLAVELAEVDSLDSIFRVSADLLRRMTGALAVSIATYDAEARELCARSVSAGGKSRRATEELAAGLFEGARVPVSDALKEEMLSSPHVKTFPGFHELTAGRMPKRAAAELKKAVGLGDIYTVALRYGGELIGGVAVFMAEGGSPYSAELLDNFGNVVTAATRRKRAEEELREREREFKQLAEGLTDVVLKVSPAAEIEYISPAIKSFGGYEPDEMVGRSVDEYFVDKADLALTMATLEKVVREKVSEKAEFLFRAKDREPFYVEVTGRPVVEGGEVVSILSVMRDISERKRAEEELRRRAEDLRRINDLAIEFGEERSVESIYVLAGDRLRQITGAKAVAVATYDASTGWLEARYVSADNAILQETGKVAGGIAGAIRTRVDERVSKAMLTAPRVKNFDGFHALSNGRVPKRVAATIEKALGLGGIHAVALRHGSEIMGGVMVFMPMGAPPYSVEILENFANVTAAGLRRKQIEEGLSQARDELEARVRERTAELTEALKELHESEDKYRKLIETLPDGVTTTDFDGVITFASLQAAAFHGFNRAEDLVGRKFYEFLAPEVHAKAAAEFQKAINEGGVRGLELTFLLKDGTRFFGEVNAGLLRDARGEPWGFIAATRDVTERKQAEEVLRRAYDELEARVRERTAALEQSNEELRSFTYLVSHDLRAPLVNLQGFTAELRGALDNVREASKAAAPYLDDDRRKMLTTALGQDVPEALSFIEASAKRMDGFINGVLKLSRLGRRDLEVERLDMTALVGETLKTLRHQLEKRKAEARVGDLPEVAADRTAMEQVMGNLLANAVFYLQPGRPGEIEVTGEREDGCTVIRVRDNGRGIARNDLKKIFEPFARVGEPSAPGEGMGLAYVQTLVRRHGGRIWCESEPGVGTTFNFTIPAQRGEGGCHA